MKKNILSIIVLLFIYIILKDFIPYWNYIVYPINLLVTFLHEFWHAFASIITGWDVKSIQINSDWSWFAVTSWWIQSIVLIGWYIGSAIFWNLLLYIWAKKEKYSEIIIYILSWIMIFTWIFWFNSIFSSIILFLISWILIFLALKTNKDWFILQFLWLASIIYIIEDFNVWPSSDLAKFSEIFIVVPQFVWMYIWLFLVIWITYFNFKNIIKE